jgi:hypothetical protein
MSSSNFEDELVALRSKVAQVEAEQKIQRMGQKMKKELMKMQQAMEKRDRETEKKELETKFEKMEAALTNEKRYQETVLENERRDRLLEDERRERQAEKKELMATLEKKEMVATSALDKKELMVALENERRDRLLEDERRERQEEKKEMLATMEKHEREHQHQIAQLKSEARISQMEQMGILGNEKRERQEEKKEMEMLATMEKHEREHQHQIEQFKSEARFSQMEQQLLEVRAYTHQGIPTSRPTIQHPAAVDPAPQRDTEFLLLQRIQQMEKEREQLKATGMQSMAIPNEDSPAHAHVPDASHQKALQSRQSTAPHKSAVVPHASRTSSQHQASQISSQQPLTSKPNEPSATGIIPSRSTPQQHQVVAALPQGNAKTAQGRPVPLPGDSDNHFFLSHCQSTGGDQTNAIYLELRQLGFACWYDNRADDLTKEGMRQGIVHAAAFLLFLSKGALDRPFCK